MVTEPYRPDTDRYATMIYRRCGNSGILLPVISLGLWHNFGFDDNFSNARAILRAAFDAGITHFDLANNYGPPYGSAEENFGKMFALDFRPYRDQLIISSKAGFDMWPGPYGEWGSRKYLVSSCDQSLKRTGLEYVDIFYSHRPDTDTPLEETMGALDFIVRSGRALYAGISNYTPEQTARAVSILKDLGTPCLIHQPRYSMFERTPEQGLFDVLEKEGVGSIVYSPLAQGLLTDRYLHGIPENSRAGGASRFLQSGQITEAVLEKVKKLNALAQNRGQSMAQMALAWLLRLRTVTSVLIGASSVQQLHNNIGCLDNLHFDNGELKDIEDILNT